MNKNELWVINHQGLINVVKNILIFAGCVVFTLIATFNWDLLPIK